MEPVLKVKSKGFKKFNQEEWLAIEKEISPFEMKVCQCMKKLGNEEIQLESVSNLLAVGEDLYLESIRKVLEKNKLVDPLPKKDDKNSKDSKDSKAKDKKAAKKPKMKKEDEMILNINIKKLEEIVMSYIKNFNFNSNDITKTTYGIERENKIEIKIVILLYFAKTLIKDKESIENNKESAYEYIIGVSKIVNFLFTHEFYSDIYKKNIKPSETSIKDLQIALEKVKNFYSYNPSEIFTDYPRFILQTGYSTYFPFHDVKPYQNQVDLISTVKDLFVKKSSGLILFKSNIGTGKTTVAVGLASLMSFLRSNSDFPVKLIFACSIEVVRHYVGRMAYNAKITFAIATMTDKGPKVINSFSNLNEKNPSLIITDLYTAHRLIQQKDEYILFVDEPTYEADTKGSPTLKNFNKLFTIAPKITILSSATLPNDIQLRAHINYFQSVLHKDSKTFTIMSQDNFVGCQIYNYDFDVYVPINNCQNVEELRNVCQVVFNDSLLRRCFTARTLFQLHSKIISTVMGNEDKYKNFKENYLNKIPDLKRVFSDVEKINQNSVLVISKLLLEILCEAKDDELVREVCHSENNYLKFHKFNNFRDDMDENHIEKSNNSNYTNNTSKNELLKYEDLGGPLAYKFLNGCMIVTDQPINFAKNSFKNLISDFVDTLEREVKSYFKSIQVYNENKKDLENRFGDREDVLAQKMKELKVPDCFSINSKYEINTGQHLAKYVKDKESTLKPRRSVILSDSFLRSFLNGEISSHLLALLFCGVGVYDEEDPSLSELYLQTVIKLAQDGILAYLVTNTSLAYGANFPINNVIITKQIGGSLTIGTLFQILGRAGRVGYSWAANAYLDDRTLSDIDYYIKKNDQVKNPEAENLAENLKHILGFDFKEHNIRERFLNNNKICLIYRYNDPKSIYATILIILYHLYLIKQSLPERKINLSLFFEFIKMNTELVITPSYKLKFKNEKYSTTYFIGMLPQNKQILEQAASVSKKVIAFGNYNLLSKISENKNNIPENILIFPGTKDKEVMLNTLDYVESQIGDLLLLNFDNSDNKFKNYKYKFNFNKDLYLSVVELFKREKNEELKTGEDSIIKSFHQHLHLLDTRKKDIHFKLIHVFLNYSLEQRRNVINPEIKRRFEQEAKEIFEERLQVFLFEGKKGSNFYVKNRNVENIIKEAYDYYSDRAFDIFIGVIIERSQLPFIPLIGDYLDEFNKEHKLPRRHLIIYDCFMEENKSRSLVYCYMNDGKNTPEQYLQKFSSATCDEIEGLCMVQRSALNDWTLG
jgi:hypothetical protein